MAICDICGKETNSRFDEVSLYRGRLTNRSITSPDVTGTKTVSTFDDLTPVLLTVCQRHKRDLFVQRLLAGAISFIILYLPALWLVSRFIPGGTRDGFLLQVIAALLVTLVLTVLLTRLVRYDGLIASMMTIEGKNKGSKFEYFTEKKYKRLSSTHPQA